MSKNTNLLSTAIGNPEKANQLDLDNIHNYLGMHLESILHIQEYYFGHNTKRNIGQLFSPSIHQTELVVLLEELLTLIFSDLIRKYSQIPTSKVQTLLEQLDVIYSNLVKSYKLDRPKIFDNMTFSAFNYELGDEQLERLILPPSKKAKIVNTQSPISVIKDQILAQAYAEAALETLKE